MQKLLYTILISFFLFSSLQGQNIHQIKAFSDAQYNNGNLKTALKEYQRVLFFDSEKLYTDTYSKLASIYFIQDDFENAIKYFNFAWRAEQNDSIKFELALKKVLSNFKQEDYFLALNELFDISEMNSIYLMNKKELYFGICYFGLDDYKNSISYFSELLDSVGIIRLNQIFANFDKFRKKFRPEKIELMSKILPGLGQIYIGDTGSGLNSFILLSGITIYAVITAIDYGFIDGMLILSSWFYRYYSGGSIKAKDSAYNKLDQEKAKVYIDILKLIEEFSVKKTL